MTCEALMIPCRDACRLDMSTRQCDQLMTAQRVRALPVVNRDGLPVGWVEATALGRGSLVEDVMHKKVAVCAATDPTEALAYALIARPDTRLIVLDATGRAIGMIGREELAAQIDTATEALRNARRHRPHAGILSCSDARRF